MTQIPQIPLDDNINDNQSNIIDDTIDDEDNIVSFIKSKFPLSNTLITQITSKLLLKCLELETTKTFIKKVDLTTILSNSSIVVDDNVENINGKNFTKYTFDSFLSLVKIHLKKYFGLGLISIENHKYLLKNIISKDDKRNMKIFKNDQIQFFTLLSLILILIKVNSNQQILNIELMKYLKMFNFQSNPYFKQSNIIDLYLKLGYLEKSKYIDNSNSNNHSTNSNNNDHSDLFIFTWGIRSFIEFGNDNWKDFLLSFYSNQDHHRILNSLGLQNIE